MAQQPQGPTAADLAAQRPEEFWEGLYRQRAQDRSARASRVNPVLAEEAAELPPGAALDLGCGMGGDTLWLARHGWTVTAVDIAPTAVERVAALARTERLDDRVTAECHDLARSFPAGNFDLVSAQYFHTPYELPRDAILRTAAEALRPGGRLLVVDHGSIAPWSWNQDRSTPFATPQEIYTQLALPSGEWALERADAPRREATGPDGRTATVTDHVLLVRRAG
ncbi:class I SAM-dependent methyltransferase [Streptomyces sp. SID2888]|uniref:SAM-dependent methyltransferase n=1 Tax=Streptomyces sp. SID2888 TaxID=2690256 RepID=UPI0013702E85|nr:class I SAM-dependent methyltransferase [Streptomyces sp. SID2888]MYV46865.1 methyltransferase domain-containing protein [Streptomyces sp. SID2888]